MARLLLGSLMAFALTANAFPGCDEGKSMAADAAKRAALGSRLHHCKVAEISEPENTKIGQDFRVTLSCVEGAPLYLVVLRELEVGVCVWESTKLLRDTPDLE